MDSQMATALVAGAVGVVGSLGGVFITSVASSRLERMRTKEADERRWLTDRRQAYGTFLLKAGSLLRSIEDAGLYLPYGPESGEAIDDELRMDLLNECFDVWEDELQPLLTDLTLIAGRRVGELSDRVTGALMEITATIETRGYFVDFYPQQMRAAALIGVLRNAMRAELGLAEELDLESPREGDWPWGDEVPSEVEYIRRQTLIPGRPSLTAREQTRLDGPA